MAPTPDVSIIIPLYNCEKYLVGCLDSVVAQTNPTWECIIIDDGSTDDSYAVAKTYADADVRFVLEKSDHVGPGAIRNRALAMASGRYVYFLDADDFIEPDMVEKTVARADKTDCDIVMWDVMFYNDRFDRPQHPPVGILSFKEFMENGEVFSWRAAPDYLFWNFQTWVWNKLFKMDFVRANGLRFQEDIARSEDVAFTYDALVLAGRMTVLGERLINYRTMRADSAMATKDRHPLDFLPAVWTLQEFLKARGVYAELERSFINWAVSTCFYNLNTLRTREAFLEVFAKLKDDVFPRLNAWGFDRAYFLSEGLFDDLAAVRDLDADDFIYRRMVTLDDLHENAVAWRDFAHMDERAYYAGIADAYDETKAELERVEQKLTETEGELEAVMGAAEQKVGRAVCAIPRAIQRRMIERSEAAEAFTPDNPKVSVVIPVYNVEKYLAECIDSVLAQTLKNIEVICVNDGSTDGSLAILEDYAAKDRRVRIITKDNAGYGHTMNRGFAAARGEYIAIVESDDFVDPRMCQDLYGLAKRNDLDVVKANFYEHSEKGDVYKEAFAAFPYNDVFDPRDRKEVMTVLPIIWAAMYKRSFIEENGISFNETPGASYQDTSFVQQVWMAARRAMLVRKGYLHYRTDNAASSVKSEAKVFVVCEEYAKSDEFMRRDPARFKAFAPMLNVLKIDTYRWNFDRIAPEFKQGFARRMAEEFKAARDEGTLDPTLFKPGDFELIEYLIDNPDAFAERYKGGLEARGVKRVAQAVAARLKR